MCTQALQEEDASEDEIQDELAPILVQLGYCYQQMGKQDLAMDLYQQVLKTKPADLAAGAVAANNAVSIKKSHELIDSLKKLKVPGLSFG